MYFYESVIEDDIDRNLALATFEFDMECVKAELKMNQIKYAYEIAIMEAERNVLDQYGYYDPDHLSMLYEQADANANKPNVFQRILKSISNMFQKVSNWINEKVLKNAPNDGTAEITDKEQRFLNAVDDVSNECDKTSAALKAGKIALIIAAITTLIASVVGAFKIIGRNKNGDKVDGSDNGGNDTKKTQKMSIKSILEKLFKLKRSTDTLQEATDKAANNSQLTEGLINETAATASGNDKKPTTNERSDNKEATAENSGKKSLLESIKELKIVSTLVTIVGNMISAIINRGNSSGSTEEPRGDKGGTDDGNGDGGAEEKGNDEKGTTESSIDDILSELNIYFE